MGEACAILNEPTCEGNESDGGPALQTDERPEALRAVCRGAALLEVADWLERSKCRRLAMGGPVLLQPATRAIHRECNTGVQTTRV